MSAPIIFHRRWIRISETPTHLRVVIHYWFGWLPFCFVCLWTFGVAYATYDERLPAMREGPGSLAVLRVHLGEIFCIVGVLILIWLVAGKETMIFKDQMMVWKRKTLGVGWSRQFALAEIRDLRVGTFPAFSARGKAITSSIRAVICFEYRGRVVRFGNEVGAEQAQGIVEAIARRYPDIVINPAPSSVQ